MMQKLIMACSFLVACGVMCFVFTHKNTADASSNSFNIVCTTNIIADAVYNIVGDTCRIKTLMGPGVDPHIYRPRESDVSALSSAHIIFYNGLHLEGKMGEVFEHMRSTIPTIAVGNFVAKSHLIEADFKGLYDPHIWHDVMLWKSAVASIADAMCALDHERADFYRYNYHRYCDMLDSVELRIRNIIARIPESKRILLTAHDAFRYFGKAYGFQVIGLQGISTDSVITAHEIQEMADMVVQHKTKAIFLESSLPSRSMEAVRNAVKARGCDVLIASELYSDSLGDQSTTASNYCDMMIHNITTIVESLL